MLLYGVLVGEAVAPQLAVGVARGGEVRSREELDVRFVLLGVEGR